MESLKQEAINIISKMPDTAEIDDIKVGTDDQVPALIDADISRQALGQNWARLIQKI